VSDQLPGYGPKDYETVRRIPVAIRERVWGGEGILAGLTAPQMPQRPLDGHLTLLPAVHRLRAAQRVRPRTLETALIDAETLRRLRRR